MTFIFHSCFTSSASTLVRRATSLRRWNSSSSWLVPVSGAKGKVEQMEWEKGKRKYLRSVLVVWSLRRRLVRRRCGRRDGEDDLGTTRLIISLKQAPTCSNIPPTSPQSNFLDFAPALLPISVESSRVASNESVIPRAFPWRMGFHRADFPV